MAHRDGRGESLDQAVAVLENERDAEASGSVGKDDGDDQGRRELRRGGGLPAAEGDEACAPAAGPGTRERTSEAAWVRGCAGRTSEAVDEQVLEHERRLGWRWGGQGWGRDWAHGWG